VTSGQTGSPCAFHGFAASGIADDDGVRALFATLPGEHTARGVLDRLTYVDDVKHVVNPQSRRIGTLQVLGEWADRDGESIATVYRQHADLGNPEPFGFWWTILHEVGHAVFFRLLVQETRSAWFSVTAGSLATSNEQSRDPEEQFCNLYARYVLRPSLVRRRYPESYQFLRERVFDGVEYD
jgi:hypothetical protein